MKNKINFQDKAINIMMYHYVRPNNFSKVKLNFLNLNKFKSQIDLIKNKSNIINNDDFEEILYNQKLPRKPCFLLTFDDGYVDHYEFVLSTLLKKKIRANFYIPEASSKNKKVLDVNKIHLILANEKKEMNILNDINKFMQKYLKKSIFDNDIKKINVKSRYDSKEIVLIKKLLQYYLPEKIRLKIIKKLFDKYVNKPESVIAKSFYMSISQLKELASNNMTLGIHGKTHSYLSEMNYEKQKKEIESSILFLNKLNKHQKKLSICYPYGSYNKNTIQIAKKKSLSFGLTTLVGATKNNNLKNKLELPRFNANDLVI